jgi:hypothetical protein
VLFALYLILFIGGMWVMGWSFSLEDFQGLVFVIGILMVSGALATPITASAFGGGRDKSPR